MGDTYANSAEADTDRAQQRIRALAQFAATYRTDYDAGEARRLGLGPSAYCYRNLDEGALVAFERPDEAATVEAAQRAARNRRYYLRRKQGLLAS